MMRQFCHASPITMNNALYSRIANRKVWLIVLMARFSKDGNFKYRMAQWMVGRYGIDELTQALMLLGCGFVLVNFFAHSWHFVSACPVVHGSGHFPLLFKEHRSKIS